MALGQRIRLLIFVLLVAAAAVLWLALRGKTLNCPVCGFRILGAAAGRSGIIEVKCHKCKFEGPVNLAYFRTRRKRGGDPDTRKRRA